MCFLIQKHVFVHNQKLLISFNQPDGIVGESLVKHIYSLVLLILFYSLVLFFSFIDHSSEECRKLLKGKQR